MENGIVRRCRGKTAVRPSRPGRPAARGAKSHCVGGCGSLIGCRRAALRRTPDAAGISRSTRAQSVRAECRPRRERRRGRSGLKTARKRRSGRRVRAAASSQPRSVQVAYPVGHCSGVQPGSLQILGLARCRPTDRASIADESPRVSSARSARRRGAYRRVAVVCRAARRSEAAGSDRQCGICGAERPSGSSSSGPRAQRSRPLQATPPPPPPPPPPPFGGRDAGRASEHRPHRTNGCPAPAPRPASARTSTDGSRGWTIDGAKL